MTEHDVAAALPVPPPTAVPSPRVAPQELTVCRVEPALWRVQRGVRLAMLLDTPLAYGSTFAREIAFPDELWVERMKHSAGWLAFEGEQPVGAVTLYQAPDQPDDEAHLVAMWVASHARGRGVADHLLRSLLEHARETGLRRVTLDVADRNSRAVGFYERTGFTRTGRTGELPHHPEVSESEMEFLVSDLPAVSG